MYLLEGRYGTLLIDTGWGSGTLRAYVKQLTSKPVTVFLTHGHLDHASGCGEWESVRMHSGAEADLKTCCRSPFDLSTLPYSNYEHVPVKDKDIIQQGDRMVERKICWLFPDGESMTDPLKYYDNNLHGTMALIT